MKKTSANILTECILSLPKDNKIPQAQFLITWHISSCSRRNGCILDQFTLNGKEANRSYDIVKDDHGSG